MASIFFTCPTTGTVVPTGQHARSALEAVLDVGGRFRCPACNQLHEWTRATATVGETKAHLRKDGTVSTARD